MSEEPLGHLPIICESLLDDICQMAAHNPTSSIASLPPQPVGCRKETQFSRPHNPPFTGMTASINVAQP